MTIYARCTLGFHGREPFNMDLDFPDDFFRTMNFTSIIHNSVRVTIENDDGSVVVYQSVPFEPKDSPP